MIRLSRKNTDGAQRLKQQMPGILDELLRAACIEIIGDVKLSFGTSPPGRDYVRGSVIHIASLEGNPPNVDLGALRASIDFEPQGPLQYRIGDGVEYGVNLELGTENMGARPFFGPVVEDWRLNRFDAFMSGRKPIAGA
jgi:hypothetical protein